MNIALYHNLPSGGVRRAMVEMVKGLVVRGHTLDEYCPETADLTFLPLNGVVRRAVVLPFRPRGVARTRVPLLTPYITAARLARASLVMAETTCCIAARMAARRCPNCQASSIVATSPSWSSHCNNAPGRLGGPG